MTTVKTLPAANYSADQVTSIVSQYKAGESLENIAKSVNKSIPSVRAKLSQLKVYISKAKKTDNGISEKTPKENKDGLKSKLESLLGVNLLNIEAASKQALLALINHINGLNTKIDALITDMLEGDDSLEGDDILEGESNA